MTSGQPKLDRPSRYPDSSGLIPVARLRGTAVTLAAAGRSPGGTTAMTYELRVGTSICERALRASNSTIAGGRVGMNGTRASSTFDGRWVNTMVLTRPMRWARRAATRYEMDEHTPVQKKMVPAVATESSKRWKSQRASNDWMTKPEPKESRLNSAASV